MPPYFLRNLITTKKNKVNKTQILSILIRIISHKGTLRRPLRDLVHEIDCTLLLLRHLLLLLLIIVIIVITTIALIIICVIIMVTTVDLIN